MRRVLAALAALLLPTPAAAHTPQFGHFLRSITESANCCALSASLLPPTDKDNLILCSDTGNGNFYAVDSAGTCTLIAPSGGGITDLNGAPMTCSDGQVVKATSNVAGCAADAGITELAGATMTCTDGYYLTASSNVATCTAPPASLPTCTDQEMVAWDSGVGAFVCVDAAGEDVNITGGLLKLTNTDMVCSSAVCNITDMDYVESDYFESLVSGIKVHGPTGTLRLNGPLTGTNNAVVRSHPNLGTTSSHILMAACASGVGDGPPGDGETPVFDLTNGCFTTGSSGSGSATDHVVTVSLPAVASAQTDIPIFTTPVAVTITSIGCNCSGTCSTPAQVSPEDQGGTAMTGGAATCATTGVATFAAVTAAGALSAGETLYLDIDNSQTAGDDYSFTATYTID